MAAMDAAEKTLLSCIRANDAVGVARLLAHGCPVNFYDSDDDNATTPLHLAVGKDIRIAEMLLDAKANPNTADDGAFTPLMQAIAEGDYAYARLLLASGADINWQESEGKITALHSAVFADNRCADGELERVRFVLQNGANPAICMSWQTHAALTPRALAVLLQGDGGDIVDLLDHPSRPARRLVNIAREVFIDGMKGRARAGQQRYKLP